MTEFGYLGLSRQPNPHHHRRRHGLRWWLVLFVVLGAVAAAYLVVIRRPSEDHSGRRVTISGNYSDDWMKMCGPVQGPAQKACTADLDEAYGRAEGKPVPDGTEDDRAQSEGK
jgi:hypothetical protein